MPHTMTSRPQRARSIVHNATRPLVTPDANALTRELTAAILERHGLLDEHPPSAVPCTAAVRQRAAALRHEVARLCQPRTRPRILRSPDHGIHEPAPRM